MNHAPHSREDLTPEERRARLRAFADRMLRALGEMETPETPDEVASGIRTALMIERLYARTDAAEALATRRAIASVEDQVSLKNKIVWSAHWLEAPPEVGFVTVTPDKVAEFYGQGATRRDANPAGGLKARIDALRSPPQTPAQTQAATQAATQATTQATTKNRPAPSAPDRLPDLQERLRQAPLTHPPIGPLIRDEDLEILYGQRLPDMQSQGHSRQSLLATLRTFSREDFQTFWPALFPLDTT